MAHSNGPIIQLQITRNYFFEQELRIFCDWRGAIRARLLLGNAVVNHYFGSSRRVFRFSQCADFFGPINDFQESPLHGSLNGRAPEG